MKYLVWGTGQKSEKIFSDKLEKIIKFIDSSSSKWGKTFLTKEVIKPSEIRNYYDNETVILIASTFFSEISNDLKQMGFILDEDYFEAEKFIISELFDGDKYYCPICNKAFNSFQDFGNPIRQSVKCPNCDSLERHRLIKLFLDKEINDQKPLKILHVAPEKSLRNTLLKRENIEYVSVDLYAPDVTYNIDITQMNVFPNNEFDLIICNHVLEHIENDVQAMKEIYRVLKPNGRALLLVPIKWDQEKTYEDFMITGPEERLIAFGQSDHVRVYGKDYIQRLNNVGFNTKLFTLKDISNINSEYIRINPEETVIVGCKEL